MEDTIRNAEASLDKLQKCFFNLRKFFNQYPEIMEKYKIFLDSKAKEDLIY